MNFEELMTKRYSARDFKEDSISKSDLSEIVRIASLSPSWANTQPWNVYIATGESLRNIRETWIKQNSKEIAGNSDLATGHREDFGPRGQSNMGEFLKDVSSITDDPDYFAKSQPILFNASAIVYLTIPKTAPMWSVYDLGAFSMSLMLAAAEKDIDSIPAYELVKYPNVLRENLPIPDDESIIAGIALGYGSDDIINSYRSKRLELDEILKIID